MDLQQLLHFSAFHSVLLQPLIAFKSVYGLYTYSSYFHSSHLQFGLSLTFSLLNFEDSKSPCRPNNSLSKTVKITCLNMVVKCSSILHTHNTLDSTEGRNFNTNTNICSLCKYPNSVCFAATFSVRRDRRYHLILLHSLWKSKSTYLQHNRHKTHCPLKAQEHVIIRGEPRICKGGDRY